MPDRESLHVAELLGDGISAELSQSVHAVADALPLHVHFHPADLSLEARRQDADACYEATLAAMRQHASQLVWYRYLYLLTSSYVFASPLRRALRTADIAFSGINCRTREVTPLAAERCFLSSDVGAPLGELHFRPHFRMGRTHVGRCHRTARRPRLLRAPREQ